MLLVEVEDRRAGVLTNPVNEESNHPRRIVLEAVELTMTLFRKIEGNKMSRESEFRPKRMKKAVLN